MAPGALFVILGSVLTLIGVFVSRRAKARYEAWQSIDAVVTRRGDYDGGVQAETLVAYYRYVVEGVAYEGRVSAVVGIRSGSQRREFEARFPPGGRLRARYNLDHPSSSQVDETSDASGFFKLIGVGLLVVGIVSLLTRR